MIYSEIQDLKNNFKNPEGITKDKLYEIVKQIQMMLMENVFNDTSCPTEYGYMCFDEFEDISQTEVDEIESVLESYDGDFFKFTFSYAEQPQKAILITQWSFI